MGGYPLFIDHLYYAPGPRTIGGFGGARARLHRQVTHNQTVHFRPGRSFEYNVSLVVQHAPGVATI